MTSTQEKQARTMAAAGIAHAQIAKALGVSSADVRSALKPPAAPRASRGRASPASPTAELDRQIAELQIVPPGETEAQRGARSLKITELTCHRARILRDLREERDRRAHQMPGVEIHGNCAIIRQMPRPIGAGIRGDKRTI